MNHHPSSISRPLVPRGALEESKVPGPPESMAPSAEALERRKQEIVNEMLKKIKPFVGPLGSIKPDADMERLGKVMEAEQEFLGRTLILTILLSSTAERKDGNEEAAAIVFLLCDRLTKCNTILSVLHKWLSDAIRAGEPICHLAGKILELLSRLHLSLDQLSSFKFGKLVKKLLTQDNQMITPDAMKKAQDLFDKWSDMIKTVEQGDGRRSSASSVEGKRSSTAGPSASAKEGAVENLDLFSEPNAPKTRAAMILERASKGQASKPTPASSRYNLS